MATLPITITGGTPNFTLTVREEGELSGNRYVGAPLTGSATVSFNGIPDSLPHKYRVTVVDGAGCADEKLSENVTCPCAVRTVTAVAGCAGLLPQLTVSWNFAQGNNVDVVVSGIGTFSNQPASGTGTYTASSGTTYTVTVTDRTFPSCSASATVTVGSCEPSCTLSISLGTPSC